MCVVFLGERCTFAVSKPFVFSALQFHNGQPAILPLLLTFWDGFTIRRARAVGCDGGRTCLGRPTIYSNWRISF